MFMNILTLISDRSYCLWLLRGAEADAQHHIKKQTMVKVKVIPQEAEVPQGVPGSLRPRIFFTFGTTRVVGPQPYVTAAFTPGEIPGTHFQKLSQPQGTWFYRDPRKKSPPIIDPGTSQIVAQCLNHSATPGSKEAHNMTINQWTIWLFTVHCQPTYWGKQLTFTETINWTWILSQPQSHHKSCVTPTVKSQTH